MQVHSQQQICNHNHISAKSDDSKEQEFVAVTHSAVRLT